MADTLKPIVDGIYRPELWGLNGRWLAVAYEPVKSSGNRGDRGGVFRRVATDRTISTLWFDAEEAAQTHCDKLNARKRHG